jgi:hypothetical protein
MRCHAKSHRPLSASGQKAYAMQKYSKKEISKDSGTSLSNPVANPCICCCVIKDDQKAAPKVLKIRLNQRPGSCCLIHTMVKMALPAWQKLSQPQLCVIAQWLLLLIPSYL